MPCSPTPSSRAAVRRAPSQELRGDDRRPRRAAAGRTSRWGRRSVTSPRLARATWVSWTTSLLIDVDSSGAVPLQQRGHDQAGVLPDCGGADDQHRRALLSGDQRAVVNAERDPSRLRAADAQLGELARDANWPHARARRGDSRMHGQRRGEQREDDDRRDARSLQLAGPAAAAHVRGPRSRGEQVRGRRVSTARRPPADLSGRPVASSRRARWRATRRHRRGEHHAEPDQPGHRADRAPRATLRVAVARLALARRHRGVGRGQRPTRGLSGGGGPRRSARRSATARRPGVVRRCAAPRCATGRARVVARGISSACWR